MGVWNRYQKITMQENAQKGEHARCAKRDI